MFKPLTPAKWSIAILAVAAISQGVYAAPDEADLAVRDMSLETPQKNKPLIINFAVANAGPAGSKVDSTLTVTVNNGLITQMGRPAGVECKRMTAAVIECRLGKTLAPDPSKQQRYSIRLMQLDKGDMTVTARVESRFDRKKGNNSQSITIPDQRDKK